jgi:flagellar motor protein MotB
MNLWDCAFILAILALVVVIQLLKNDSEEIKKLETQVGELEYLLSLKATKANTAVIESATSNTGTLQPNDILLKGSFDKSKRRNQIDIQEKRLAYLRSRRDIIWAELFPYLKEETASISLGEDKIYFNSGEAVPRSQNPITGQLLEDALSEIFKEVEKQIDKWNMNVIQVEAHTDTVPIHNENFEDNWELSVNRARYLAKKIDEHLHTKYKRIEQYVVIAAGYSEYLPNPDDLKDYFKTHKRLSEDIIEISNETAEGKQKNRRLVVNFFRRKFVK